MKKILLLGGSAQQIVAIKTAKRLGYFTILCDYLEDNPGQFDADQFYLVSTTDKDAVLDVAIKEHIDGILAYASDPAAPTAAFVAEKLRLPGNPYKAVDIMCNKDKFRAVLAELGLPSPKHHGYVDKEEAMRALGQYRMPVIVKPVDSSGSKGITVVNDKNRVSDAIDFALGFSRSGRFIIEEYIEKDHPFLIGGDVFVCDGKVIVWGLMNCHRDPEVNMLVPVGKSYPPLLSDEYLSIAKKTLQTLIDGLEYQNGAINVELVVDRNHNCWVLDIGPRNGGNMIPDLMGYIFGIDIVEMTVQAAMGISCQKKVRYDEKKCYATHNLHTSKSGRFRKVRFDDDIERVIFHKEVYKHRGDEVAFFDNATKALGIVFMRFDDVNTMMKTLENINQHIVIEIDSINPENENKRARGE